MVGNWRAYLILLLAWGFIFCSFLVNEDALQRERRNCESLKRRLSDVEAQAAQGTVLEPALADAKNRLQQAEAEVARLHNALNKLKQQLQVWHHALLEAEVGSYCGFQRNVWSKNHSLVFTRLKNALSHCYAKVISQLRCGGFYPIWLSIKRSPFSQPIRGKTERQNPSLRNEWFFVGRARNIVLIR